MEPSILRRMPSAPQQQLPCLPQSFSPADEAVVRLILVYVIAVVAGRAESVDNDTCTGTMCVNVTLCARMYVCVVCVYYPPLTIAMVTTFSMT